MYQRKIPIDYDCGLIIAMEVVGSKWKFCILDAVSKGVKRPRDLAKGIRGVTRRVLQNQLRELELHGMLEKTVYAEVPLRTEYYLTETGKTLLPLIVALDQWGLNFAPQLKAILEGESVNEKEESAVNR